MHLSNFRFLGVLAVTAFLAGMGTLPTRAKEVTPAQEITQAGTVNPFLIAQAVEDSAATVESRPSQGRQYKGLTIKGAQQSSEDFVLDPAVEGAEEIIPQIKENVDGSVEGNFTPAVSVLNIPLPLGNFAFFNGGIAQPNGPIDRALFNNLFTQPFGVLSGTNNSVLIGPLTSFADSGVSPAISQVTASKLVSVALSFIYSYPAAPGDIFQIQVINVTTGQLTGFANLPPTAPGIPSINATIDITNTLKGAGAYRIRFLLSKPNATFTDVVGFNNASLSILRN